MITAQNVATVAQWILKYLKMICEESLLGSPYSNEASLLIFMGF